MKLALCQRDAYLKTLQTEVRACEPSKEGHRVILAETILYATGGGQPADGGSIGGQRVLDVQKSDEGTVHILEGPVSGSVAVEVDWARRFDHMQQHTGQHLVTAVASARFGWETVGFHLGESGSTIDLDVSALDDAQLQALEDAVNEEIRAARAVRHKIVTAADLDALDVRTRGLPDGFEGPVRLIEIEGLDLNTCGGTHLASTAELQIIELTGTEKIRGQTRLSYLAGGRVRTRLDGVAKREKALGKLLAAGPEDHVGRVQKHLDDGRDAIREVHALQSELIRHIANELAQTKDDLIIHHRHDVDLKFLGRVAGALQAIRPKALALLLTSPAATGPGLFLLVGPPELVKAAGPTVSSLLEGRGGGPPGRFQGKLGKIELKDDAFELLAQIARSTAS